MKKKPSTKSKNGKFKFEKYQILGSPDAESDKNLEQNFIDRGETDVLTDVEEPKCIILGRTGSGKSAILKHITNNNEYVSQIEPEDMSLKYLSNSSILNYFKDLGINLTFFYKVLWKHVLLVEILKLYLGNSDKKKVSLLQKFASFVSGESREDSAKKSALAYFDTWSDDFWLESEHRIKELENELEKKFASEVGVDNKFLKSNFNYHKLFKERSVTEIKNKAEKVVSETLAKDLVNLIKLMSDEVFNNYQRKYYIIIDNLDKDWASDQNVYDLIGAMVEVIKEFQDKFKGVKIIISLRENLHHLVFTGKEHRGGQREKYSHMYMGLNWNKEELKRLINARILTLTHNKLNVESVFKRDSANTEVNWKYIVERTFLRPRDAITFFNRIIQAASAHNTINSSVIYEAERFYSKERLDALEDEWNENYGYFIPMLRFLMGKHDGMNFENIKPEPFFEQLMDDKVVADLKGDLLDVCLKWKSGGFKTGTEWHKFLQKILYILYDIGIVGIKIDAQHPKEFYYDAVSNIDEHNFKTGTKIYVHKAFFSVLKINSREQEADFLA